MTHNDKDTELYDKAEEMIEEKPTFAEGETYGEVTVSDTDEIVEERVPIAGDEQFGEFNEAEELIEKKPEFAEGETYGEVPISDERDQEQPALSTTLSEVDEPIFTDSETYDESHPDDHDHPQAHIGLLPLDRINHPLR